MYMFNSKKNMCTKFDVMVIFCYLDEKTHFSGFPNVLRSFCNFQLSRDPRVIFGPMGFFVTSNSLKVFYANSDFS